ncbi:unnamed protein product, partial [marine sediment metagenome]
GLNSPFIFYTIRYRLEDDESGTSKRWQYAHFADNLMSKSAGICYGEVRGLRLGKAYDFDIEAHDALGVSTGYNDELTDTPDAANPADLSAITPSEQKCYPTRGGFWKAMSYRIKLEFTVPASAINSMTRRFEIRVARNITDSTYVKWSVWETAEIDASTPTLVTVIVPLAWVPRNAFDEGEPSSFRINVRSWIGIEPGGASTQMYSGDWDDPDDWYDTGDPRTSVVMYESPDWEIDTV